MKSVMAHDFSLIPKVNIQRSSFDRTHAHKTTFDAGQLIPIYCDEVLPGDSFNLRMNAFARMATPINPVMDNMYLDSHFFFVPTRLVWENFKRFMGEQTFPGQSTDLVIPNATYTVTENSLLDYFGLPLVAGLDGITDLPLRCYNLIFNEWFRDQNLQQSIPVETGDSAGDIANYLVRRRGKRHDYFTSALPFPQKGESVDLPLGTTAPVTGIGVVQGLNTGGDNTSYVFETNYPETGGVTYGNTQIDSDWSDNWRIKVSGNNGFRPEIYADLSSATSATINQLRQAFQIQRLLEKDARGGTRYVEIIQSHYGLWNAGGDARLQRPEYLGGGSSPVNITPIAQTSGTDTTPQGNLAAMGTVSATGHGFTKSFTEHGYIIGLVSVRADLTYSQGVNRMWSRRTRYDMYWPTLAHIGEQAILRKELFATGTEATDNEVFGYQERFAEYRYKPSLITGRFRPDASLSLDSWHLSQDLTSATLNASFIEENPPVDRVIAVPSEPHFIFDSFISLRCARPMPLFGVPGMIDHF